MTKNIGKPKFTFLFGAGCEGMAPFRLPNGTDFKQDTVKPKDVTEIFKRLNPASKYIPRRGVIISPQSYVVLYQTLKEYRDKFSFNGTEEVIVNNYLASKDRLPSTEEAKTDEEQETQNSDKEARKRFKELYATSFYEPIPKNSNIKENSNLQAFLKYAGIYSFLDSNFNYLRQPDNYKNEVARVLKVYFAAFNSIVSKMYEQLKDDDEIREYYTRLYDQKNGGHASAGEARKELQKMVDKMQELLAERCKNNDEYKEHYYRLIRDIFDNAKTPCELKVVTSNYTLFAEKCIGLLPESIAYVHGRLDWFESLENKLIDRPDKLNETDTIFPFTLVQSGVKPVISPMQIKELGKAVDAIENAEQLYVVGYGINSDDEHITTMLRERLQQSKPIIVFIHITPAIKFEDECDRINKLFEPFKHLISYYTTDDFEKVLRATLPTD